MSNLGNDAVAHLNQGRFEDAIACHDKVLELDPDHTYTINQKAETLVRLEKYEEAIVCFDRLIALGSYEEDSLIKKGLLLLALRRCNEAFFNLDKSLRLNPWVTNHLWVSYAAQFGVINQCLQAAAYFDRLLEANPRGAEALTRKGFLLIALGRRWKALNYFDKALEVNPEDVDAVIRKGCLLLGMRRNEEAATYFDRALEIDPDNADVQFMLEKDFLLI